MSYNMDSLNSGHTKLIPILACKYTSALLDYAIFLALYCIPLVPTKISMYCSTLQSTTLKDSTTYLQKRIWQGAQQVAYNTQKAPSPTVPVHSRLQRTYTVYTSAWDQDIGWVPLQKQTGHRKKYCHLIKSPNTRRMRILYYWTRMSCRCKAWFNTTFKVRRTRIILQTGHEALKVILNSPMLPARLSHGGRFYLK